jgi:hypothetical protein
MNWDAIGAVGEIVSAIAVLVTLVYLAGQVRQSNRIGVTNSEAQYRQMAQAANRSIMELPDNDPFLIQLLETNPEYTPTQYVKAVQFARILANLWAFADSSFRNNLLDSAAFHATIDDVRVTFKEYPGLKPAFAFLFKEYASEKTEENPLFLREIALQLKQHD